MTRKVYNKLIRDKIPEIIKKDGRVPEVSVLSEEEYKKALKQKLVEEAKEFLEAEQSEDILDELCDVEELIGAIAQNSGISMEELERKRKNKLKERGGFKKKLFLKYVDRK